MQNQVQPNHFSSWKSPFWRLDPNKAKEEAQGLTQFQEDYLHDPILRHFGD